MPTLFNTSANIIQVYEWQTFIHEFRIYTPVGLGVTPFTGSISSVTVSYWSSVPTSLSVVWNNDSSILTFVGFHQNIFVQDQWSVRNAEFTTSQATYQGLATVPGRDQFWAAQSFTPDTRSNSAITVTVGFSDGGSITWNQVVQQDRTRLRNQVCSWIGRGLQERPGESTRQPCVSIPFPQASTSELLQSFAYSTSITTNVFNYDFTTDATALGWDGVTPINAFITISASGQVLSSSTSTAALIVPELPVGSTVQITNEGLIIGRGGDGGRGANIAFGNQFSPALTAASVPGGPGGPAISISSDVVINNTGTIGGGGGGGGGGGYAYGVIYCDLYGGYCCVWSHNTIGDGGAGGGGAGFGSPGTFARTASSGTLTTGGAATTGLTILRRYTGAIISSDYAFGYRGGAGGAGGALGAAGTIGNSGFFGPSTGCLEEGSFSATSPAGLLRSVGGAAGKAIELNGHLVSFINTGTVSGAVS